MECSGHRSACLHVDILPQRQVFPRYRLISNVLWTTFPSSLHPPTSLIEVHPGNDMFFSGLRFTVLAVAAHCELLELGSSYVTKSRTCWRHCADARAGCPVSDALGTGCGSLGSAERSRVAAGLATVPSGVGVMKRAIHGNFSSWGAVKGIMIWSASGL